MSESNQSARGRPTNELSSVARRSSASIQSAFSSYTLAQTQAQAQAEDEVVTDGMEMDRSTQEILQSHSTVKLEQYLDSPNPVTDRSPNPMIHTLRPSSVHMYMWGSMENDQIPLKRKEGQTSTQPQLVTQLDGKDLIHIAAGPQHVAFLSESGDLYTAGQNTDLQLGVRNPQPDLDFHRVATLEQLPISTVACGSYHTVAVTSMGKLVTWGSGEFGQLGHGNFSVTPQGPKVVKMNGEHNFVRVAAGETHSLALTSSGTVYSWGNNAFGALGHGGKVSVAIPTRIDRLWTTGIAYVGDLDERFTSGWAFHWQVACGENHSAALSLDGRVYTWGLGKTGQLGHDSTETLENPARVQELDNVVVMQIACGSHHTVALTITGHVYTWGNNQFGQLGLESFVNQLKPQEVLTLSEYEVNVKQIAAGAFHTLALTNDNQTFGWGANQEHQLALPEIQCFQKPQKLYEPQNNEAILYIFAQGDISGQVVQQLYDGDIVPIGPSYTRIAGQHYLPVKLPPMQELIAQLYTWNTRDKQADLSRLQHTTAHQQLLRAIQDLFSSPGYLASGFTFGFGSKEQSVSVFKEGSENWIEELKKDDEPWIQEQSKSQEILIPADGSYYNADLAAERDKDVQLLDLPGNDLDLKTVVNIFHDILKLGHTDLIEAMFQACMSLLQTLSHMLEQYQKHHPQYPPEGEWLKVLLIMQINPINLNTEKYGYRLIPLITEMCTKIYKPARLLMIKWFMEVPTEQFAARLVTPLQNYIRHVLERYQMNRVKREIFAQLLETDKRNIMRHGLATLCQVPFVLTPEAKARILQGEAQMVKQREMQGTLVNAIIQHMPLNLAREGIYLDIRVRRSNLLQDAVQQLRARESEYKKPLKVTFMIEGGVEEEGQDEGGVSKEFFQLLIKELFSEDYGMFKYDDETRTYWFSLQSLDQREEFKLVGCVLGLAIYNGIILDVHFPLLVYKKLQGKHPVTFRDLLETFPTVGRGLQQLLNFDGDVESTFTLMFDVSYEFYGDTRVHELKPGGSQIPVTNENRFEYVRLYTQWKLNTSIEQSFIQFAKGFHTVCGGPAISLNRYEELELLVCGLPHLDFEQLKEGTKYDGKFNADHPYIKQFWSVIEDLTFEQKKRFLSFATGSDRAPVGGLGRLNFVIQRAGPDTERLPTSHTCFNVLLLPEYSSKDRLRDRLLTAIENAEGFGLQ